MAQFAPPQGGQIIDGYELLHYLGSGSMGRVYLARDTRLDRLVALKFIAGAGHNPEVRQRFMKEARAIGRVHHPNVMAIHRVAEQQGMLYIDSEYVPGQTLKAIAKPLPEAQIRKVGAGLARGLYAAHRRGVLHRDIKPENAVLAEDGEAKLLDFGLAKFLEEEAGTSSERKRVLPADPELALVFPEGPLGQTTSLDPAAAVFVDGKSTSSVETWGAERLTRTGTVMGTPLYMAPEVWRGEPATKQSDLYSLGAVLFELCRGHPPHTAVTQAELRQLVCESDAPALRSVAPNISSSLADLIDRCLRRKPEERLESAAQLAQALDSVSGQPVQMPSPGENPYRGLRPFEAKHRALFFGRSSHLDSILEQLRNEPLVLVAGDSGVGKSSLCRAGVLPLVAEGALGEGRSWQTVTLLPGRRPLWALAGALAPVLGVKHAALELLLQEQPRELLRALRIQLGDSRGLVIFMDQLEELVTQSDVPEAVGVGELLGHLSDRAPGVRVLATVRGDFLTRLAETTDLSQELSRGLYLLRPLSASDLREAIVGPARLSGVTFESDELVQEMVESTVKAQGSLPLLQFALAELWAARDVKRGLITQVALARLGGVAGALARHADGVINRLLPAQHVAAQRLLVKLVTLEGTRLVRSEQELLTDDPAEYGVLDRLVRERLLVARSADAGDTAYEVAHEALLRGWTTLQDWLSAAAGRRGVQQRLESAASEWERLGRPREALWSARQLFELDAVALDPDDLPPRALFFLREARRNLRRSQGLRFGYFAVLCLLAAGSVLSYWQWQQRRKAQEIQAAEDVVRLSQQSGKEIEALAKAVQLIGKRNQAGAQPLPEEIVALNAARTSGGPMVPPMLHQGPVRWAAFSPDGKRIVSASEDGTARVWRVETGEELLKLRGGGGPVRRAEFSPDGTWIVTLDSSTMVSIWEASSGTLLRRLVGHSAAVNAFAFSPDSLRLVTASDDKTARVWELSTGRPVHVLAGHSEAVRALAVSFDGARILTASSDRTAKLWDAPTGREQARLIGHTGGLRTASFSLDGRLIVTGGEDQTARLWDGPTGEPRAVLRDHRSPVITAIFTPDSTRLVTIAEDDVIGRIWNTALGTGVVILGGGSEPVRMVVMSNDGSQLVTVSTDHEVRLWDGVTGESRGGLKDIFTAVNHVAFSLDGCCLATANQNGELLLHDLRHGSEQVLAGHLLSVWKGAVAPDGNQLATAGGDGTVRLWSAQDGRLQKTLVGHQGVVLDVSYSPDGGRLASTGTDGTVRVWEPQTGAELQLLTGHEGPVSAIRFSPDGSLLLSVGSDRTGRIWETNSGRLQLTLRGHTARIWRGVFSPDGNRIVTASEDSTARIWDSHTGRALHTLAGHRGPLTWAEFSPDGWTILTAGKDHTARIWDAMDGHQKLHLARHVDEISQAAFSPDGKRVVTAGFDWTAFVWNAQNGTCLAALTGHKGRLLSISYSEDGQTIVTTSSDGTARLWDATDGRPLAVLSGHGSSVVSATFYRDGKHVLTTSTDHSARVFPTTLSTYLRLSCEKLSRWQLDSVTRDICRRTLL